MSEVKRFDVPSMRSLTQGEQAVMGYEVVLASDYDALAAKLAMAEDAAAKGDAASHQCGGMEMEIQELKTKLAELEKQEPVAWMHDQPNRVDVIHRDVKDLLQRVPGSSRGIYRPLDVSEHYTIPLYAAPVAQAQHSVPIAPQLKRALGLVVAALEADGDRPTSKYALSELKKVLAAAPGKEVPQAWIDVQAERRRQVEAEGWTPEHDDLYCAAELPRAAAAYILNGANDEAPAVWPFVAKWWKPRDARSNYVRAGALILAEIERLDRAAAPGKEVDHE